MTEDEVRKIVQQSVHETLTTLGMDVSDPEAVLALQADHAYLRRSRLGADEVAKWVKRGVITAGTSGLLYTAWEGFKGALRLKGGG
jgi:hypothetical protein